MILKNIFFAAVLIFGFMIFGIASTSLASCPRYESPDCKAPEALVQGKDASGCAMPMCQKSNEACPNYTTPRCAVGLHLSLASDPKFKNCRKPVCVAMKDSERK